MPPGLPPQVSAPSSRTASPATQPAMPGIERPPAARENERRREGEDEEDEERGAPGASKDGSVTTGEPWTRLAGSEVSDR